MKKVETTVAYTDTKGGGGKMYNNVTLNEEVVSAKGLLKYRKEPWMK